MNTKNIFKLLLTLSAAGGVMSASAAPFQMEGVAGIGKTTIDFSDGDSFELDNLSIGGRYFLQPVDSTTGPLDERPFIDKSAHIGLLYLQQKPEEGNEDVTSTGLDARFVTLTDMIFDVGYLSNKLPGDNKITTTSIGVGKYLDSRTTGVLRFERSSNDGIDVDAIGGTFRRLVDGAVDGTAMAYEIDLAYIDAPEDNGYEIGLDGTYYPSTPLGISGGLSRADIGDSDSTTFSLEARYFFTETLAAGALYSKTSDSDNDDVTIILLNVGARF